MLDKMARWTRLELATPCVTGRYSNQLNYRRNHKIERKMNKVHLYYANAVLSSADSSRTSALKKDYIFFSCK